MKPTNKLAGSLSFRGEGWGEVITPAQQQAIINAGSAYTEKAGHVAIDVNGPQGPNRWGRDLFLFAIGENGTLYPYGGTDVALFNSNGANTTERWDAAGAEIENCVDNSGDGWGCTARVVEDGYRINY